MPEIYNLKYPVVWYVYIVRCVDNSLYTGITTDIERRMRQHNSDIRGGAKYTRMRRPVCLVYAESVSSRSMAAKREYEIRNLNKIEKEALISLYQT